MKVSALLFTILLSVACSTTQRPQKITAPSKALAVIAEDFVVPAGTRTDCGPGFSTYTLRTDVPCTATEEPEKTRCSKLRWGPQYPTSDNAGRCQASESDMAPAGCFPMLYGREATRQDRLDLGYATQPWLAQQVQRECCNRGFVPGCAVDNPFVVKQDRDTITKRVRTIGMRVTCEALRADTQPCGLQEGWNCYFQYPIWFRNEAPHCLGAPPPPPGPTCGDGTCLAPETCSTCPADCGECPPPPPPPLAGSWVIQVRCSGGSLVLSPPDGSTISVASPSPASSVVDLRLGSASLLRCQLP